MGGDDFDWNTDDELEIENYNSSSSCLTLPNGDAGEASSSAVLANSKVLDHFVNMGFSREMVSKVIQEYGEENEDKLLEELLSYKALESSPQPQQRIEPDPCSSENAGSSWDDFSDTDIFSDDEEIAKTMSENDDTLRSLVKMGYKQEEALVAIERLGPNASLEELVDFIGVAQMAKAEDALLPPEEKLQYNDYAKSNKRRFYDYEVLGRKKPRGCEKKILNEDDDEEDEALHLPNPMIGFGVPTDAKLTERIRKAVEIYDEDPPESVQKFVLHQCRKWNLVWVGRNKVAPLEPDEVETLLGFPRNHTRGGGISRTDRYKSLGNSFQVDTVAYHLSVLKEMYPNGINLLSLFSGIGGAEVALHRLGIPLKNVVSVEKSEVNRNIVRSWWEQTNQKGNLYDIDDVRELDGDRLEQLMSTFGGFDLIVGGSPCNNLAGSNRVSRDGLEGKESSLFFDYFRILDLVKNMSAKYR
ncbi:hypothetical protein JHK85_052763 [Glycine max]|nr:hypothetical protein JHK85_052763 [Glycine max]